MITIYESFEKLEDCKKQIIINAGFKIFGEDGYKKASVEQIIQEAGISKGSLFYYFDSKKNFYLYLYDYCAVKMKEVIDNPGPDGLPAYMQITDFFERIQAVQRIKTKHAVEHPHMFEFMKSVVIETSPVVQEEIQHINQILIKERTLDFFHNLDLYKFKDGIDPKMVLQLLTWCSEGSANQVILRQKMNPSQEVISYDFNEIIKIYNNYVEMIQKNFYKEEYI